jgi:hypothetical protein
MLIKYLMIALQFILIVLFQVLILNNVHLKGLMNPYYYPIFILLLPLSIPQWVCLLLSFLMGISVGSFTHSSGLHAIALLVITYIRPFLITIIFPKSRSEEIEEISILKAGFLNFAIYLIILTFIHHLIFFIFEVLSFNQFYFTLIKIILSTILSFTLMIIGEFLFQRKKVNT